MFIGSDCQHDRSQRKGCKRFDSAARFGVTTVQNHASLETNGKILAQIIVTCDTLEEHGMGQHQSKDKLGSEIVIKLIASKLDRIDLCISDQSSSCRKSYEDHIISSSKHSHVKLGYDPWHVDKALFGKIEDVVRKKR